MTEAAGFMADEGFGELLGGLVGEQDGVDVGDLGELFGDCGIDPRMAVAEAGDGGTAGAVDNFAAVGGVQIDPLPSRREHGIGEQGAVEDTAHGERAASGMVRPQPGDIGRDGGRAGLDATVIGIDGAGSRSRLARRVVEKGANIIMQGAPVQRDDQDENPTTISMRMRRCWDDEGRAQPRSASAIDHGGIPRADDPQLWRST